MLAEEIERRKAARRGLGVFGEEMDRVEANWVPKLEDPNEESARLQLKVKEDKETLGTTIEKSVTLGLEVEEKGKEIATLCKVMATLYNEEVVKTVGKRVGI